MNQMVNTTLFLGVCAGAALSCLGAFSATLSGAVTTSTKGVKTEVVKMAADPKCVELNQNKEVLRDDLVINSLGQIKDVFVYVKSGLKPSDIPPVDRSPKTLDQHGCMFSPKVIGLRVGQGLKIRNSDANGHNVRSLAKNNSKFNYSMPRALELPNPATFSKPELGIRMKCDLHGWMVSYIQVVDHPFFAVTDENGKFQIENLPPGEYTIEARHENPRLGVKTVKVSVGTGPAVANISYSLAPN